MFKKVLLIAAVAMCFLAMANAEVVELNPDNFDKIVKDSSKNVFVMFYAPWCGHCNHMKPAWEELGKSFENADTIIAKVDASQHRDIGKAYGVQGFPTLKFFSKTNKSGIEYEGGRDIASFNTYIKKHAA